MSARENALSAVVERFLEIIPEPPSRNCSCHISPPCNDCVTYAAERELFEEARAALTMPGEKA